MRTLKRPMFRMGGSANEGITSGLDKPKRGLVNEPGSYAGEFDKLFKSADEYVTSRRPKETYKDRDDFLINLGLDMVSRPPSGNIISTIGESAKGPFKQLQAGQAQKRKTQAESESDLFNTLVGAGAKMSSGGADGKGWLEQWKFNKIPELINEIDALEKKIDSGTATEQDKLDLRAKETQFNRLDELDPFVKSYINSEEGEYLWVNIKTKLFSADQQLPEEQRRYKNINDLQLELDSIAEAKKEFRNRGKKAEGGRAGYKRGMAVVQDDERTNYQNGMTAMPAAGDMMQATGDMGLQDDSAPEELTNELTFEELRQRLPQEIGDDIINLILSSAEAMEDFATIQTEDDISTFNKKYGVNLVLPSEG